jgi:hypothetical protein
MALISVTRLRVRSFIYLPQFLWDTFKSVRQVKRSTGFLGGRLLVNAKSVFWTMTVWKDEAAMNAYRTGGPHRVAMPKLLNWCDEAAVVHWTQDSSEIPFGERSLSGWRKIVQGVSSLARSGIVSNSSS